MRLPLLLLCLAVPASVGGQPPPKPPAGTDPWLLLAARERQKATIGFEVSLSVRMDCRNVRPVGQAGRADFTETGTATLAVDTGKFRCTVDAPVYDRERRELTRRREEVAFDGTRVYSRPLPAHGQSDPPAVAGTVFEDRPPDGWGEPFLPFEWTFRGTHTIFNSTAAVDVRPTGREERIDGRRMIEIVREVNPPGRPEPLWLDADRLYMPWKVRGVRIETGPHPGTMWAPVSWTFTTETAEPGKDGVPEPGVITTTVTVDSFVLRRGMPAERFTLAFPAGSRVIRHTASGPQAVVVAADGSLVPEGEARRSTLPPLGKTLAVVGVAVALFVGLMVLLRRLGRGSKATGRGS